MIIFLIRHGESLSRDGMSHLQGEGIGLSPTGRKQAEIIGRTLSKLKMEAIISSGMGRAKETASIIQSFCHAPLLQDLRLNEHVVSRQETNRRIIKELRQKVRQERDFIPPEGESFNQAVLRFRKALEEIGSKYKDNVAVVSHREIIQNFLLSEFSQLSPIHEASWSVIEYAGVSFRIVKLNISPFSFTFLWQGIKRRMKTLLGRARLNK